MAMVTNFGDGQMRLEAHRFWVRMYPPTIKILRLKNVGAWPWHGIISFCFRCIRKWQSEATHSHCGDEQMWVVTGCRLCLYPPKTRALRADVSAAPTRLWNVGLHLNTNTGGWRISYTLPHGVDVLIKSTQKPHRSRVSSDDCLKQIKTSKYR